MKENIQTTRLANGLTILTEKMPDVRSATVGIWLKKGSRHEPAHLNGILHFIEHAVFKGTKRRSALDIAVESDRLGGHLDAFTSHEITGFMMKVVDKNAIQALDLIADMLANPNFDEKEMRREQKVILEEIKMVEDSPEEILGEIFTEKFFPNHPLGLPIEGTRKTVKTFNHKATLEFHQEIYSPKNLVVAAAGNIEHAQIVDLMEKTFGHIQRSEMQNLKSEIDVPIPAAPIVIKRKQNLEQAHVIIASPWLSATDERRYAGSLLVSILGDGNSSRLWQTIREKRGLAYSVGADASDFQDCGIFSIYAGCSPEKVGEVVDLSIAELKKIKLYGVSEDELNLAKEQTTASILLGLEDSASRAEVLAQQEITHGRIISVEESLEKFNRVTVQEIQDLAKEFFQTEKIALGALGNLNKLKIKRERLDVS
jgi:predicted Zn-dependent peptidase